MLYGKYDFHCEFGTEAVLPRYKGSTFRGVFGLALKRVVCALKRQDCKDCILKKRCVYARIFESVDPVLLPDGRVIHSPLRPFVIEPPPTETRRFPPGAHFDFSLLLFGETNHNLPYFIYAFDRMGKTGIGSPVSGKRGRFSLKTVSSRNHVIFSHESQQLDMENAFVDMDIGEARQTHDVSRVKITLETPLRFKRDNRLSADLPFPVFTRIMLRRANMLFHCHAQGPPPMDYPGLLDRAGDVVISRSSLRWFDWLRYSGRQAKEMRMGGVIGNIVYEGNLTEYMPLMDFCKKVHLGKQTAFGLGKFGVEVLGRPLP
ncbi:conserved hypothetical protein [Candidatus Desulfarcum epimagneticum]|uniref:CRISPR-associated protein Cas6 C-terminal domain-containing protein n=1 Tax=uncultured Desulfobacteraceae bacterium TaxID=218296 RepID=A0A484HDM9_9BACT|nr:conserved hypothetical protein [uncultured Desulfobacteraceae bacterium]